MLVAAINRQFPAVPACVSEYPAYTKSAVGPCAGLSLNRL